jgi:hypothetical protein
MRESKNGPLLDGDPKAESAKMTEMSELEKKLIALNAELKVKQNFAKKLTDQSGKTHILDDLLAQLTQATSQIATLEQMVIKMDHVKQNHVTDMQKMS